MAESNNLTYFKELAGAIALYVIILTVALVVGRGMSPGLLQVAVLVSPMLPFVLVVLVIVRQIRRSDEFIRKTSLEYLAIAAAVTAGWTFTYGFLETSGYPRLSMFTVWPVMGAVWGVLAVVGSLRHR
ncbi:MAG: hypothetical protein IPM06_20360 [Rhizobiales bacterium]|nr:hypothetical protein [Hyphomicrobiales bacterium]